MERFKVKLDGRLGRYALALALAVMAEAALIPFEQPTSAPLIVYAPFIIVSALVCGLGPGLLTAGFCLLGAAYFHLEPVGSLSVTRSSDWDRLAALAATGIVVSVLAEQRRRIRGRLAETNRKTSAMLESISDGFNAFDHEWRYTFVNAAGARLVGKTPEQLIGKNLWELWPEVVDSPFGAAYRRSVAENVPLQVEAFFEPLNAWFEVRCYPSSDGLSLFFTDTTARRRVQERLGLLESAALQTTDGILILKVSGEDFCCQEPVFANAAFERITGFTIEDLREGAIPELYRDGVNPHQRIDRQSGFRKSCPDHLERRSHRKDGSEFWAEWTFKPLAGKDGTFTHCVWTCRDITERRKAEEESRLLGTIVEFSEDAIVGKNLDGIVLSWNKGAEQIYGYSAEEMIGQSASILFPPDHPDEFKEIMEYIRLGQRLEHMETERIRKDGSRIVVSVTISPLRDESGAVTGASTIARDITDRKRAQEALAHSELRYRSLVRVVSQIVWTTDSQGEVVSDIPSWREFTGETFDRIKGWGWLETLHPDDRERTARIWSQAVNAGSFYMAEYRMRRSDGEYRWMLVHGAPILNDHGQVQEWVGICVDIHDRIMAEEEIRQLNQTLETRVVERTAALQAANKELEAFAYSVSHDLRAPLRAISGFSRILLEEFGAACPAEAHRYLGIVNDNAVQMGTLIDGLLSFSRLGRQALNIQTVAPEDLVRQALADLSSEQQGRQVEITVADLPPCQADPLLLKQVFFNLLANSLKYTRNRPVSRVEVGSFRFAELAAQTEVCQNGAPRGAEPDAAIYYVRDNGAGFDMRYADKLFGVFQRLHRAEEYEGTGVGLATVRRIITRHGGSVWAEAALDQGAAFYFTLEAQGVAQLSGSPETSAAELSGERS
ncbi:MAG TPA: PAS domain S-box protein [Bryobacteraceae bacterium]|nr:PAS domain S-box protein [Bryobacteraceae bacterium]